MTVITILKPANSRSSTIKSILMIFYLTLGSESESSSLRDK